MKIQRYRAFLTHYILTGLTSLSFKGLKIAMCVFSEEGTKICEKSRERWSPLNSGQQVANADLVADLSS